MTVTPVYVISMLLIGLLWYYAHTNIEIPVVIIILFYVLLFLHCIMVAYE